MLHSEQILCTRYHLQRQLGRTGAGRQTWLTTDLQTSEQVIVKLLAFSPQMQWQELELFEREAKVLQNLNHPCIPRYRDYFSLDQETGGGLPWFGLVQDYIPGSSLQDLLEQGKRWNEAEVRQMAIAVLKILTYLHELSPPVLHRDIKPSNLILGEDTQIYLVDFGAVQAQAAVTGVTFTIVGTSGYAPLEQFWGRSVAASDLYALGATLIHLLTGTAPADLPQKRSRIQFADRVSLSPAFVSWITKLTDPILEERFVTAREAQAALESGQMISTTTRASPIKKVAQPDGSRIQVSKSEAELEIYIPSCLSGGLSRRKEVPFLTNAEFIAVFVIILLLLFLSTVAVPWLFMLMLLPIVLLVATTLLYRLTKGSRVRLDRHHFAIAHRHFGLTTSQQTGSLLKITGAFIKSGTAGEDQIHGVILRVDQNSYFLEGDYAEAECFWLVQEIQDWLNQQVAQTSSEQFQGQ